METNTEQKDYNREYYESRKAEISAKRKRKYHSDPSYRAKVQAKARNRYKKKERSQNKRVGYTVKRVDEKNLFTISYVSQVSGKSEHTLRSWERQGIIPLSTYTDTRGWRLYTSEQIERLSYAFQQFDAGVWDKAGIKEYLTKNW